MQISYSLPLFGLLRILVSVKEHACPSPQAIDRLLRGPALLLLLPINSDRSRCNAN